MLHKLWMKVWTLIDKFRTLTLQKFTEVVMDPVGPWSAYASYNRLAGVQAGAASGDFHHHLASGGSGLGSQSVPSTTSQLLLQAAHTTASLAGQLGSSTASPFNPGGFLSPPTVGYDAVFSPLFHHASPKPAHYSSSLQAQHRQVIAQAQAAVASKQSSVETELSSLRENYSHQTLTQGTSFFDQSSTPGGTAGLSWQGNNQLPSPFGILPHESVVPSSPSPATTKASATYENFNAHFAAAQTLNNHLNSQISSAGKQTNRSGSPATASKQPVSSTSSTFFQSPPAFGNQTDNSYSASSAKSGQLSSQQDYAGSKSYSSSASSAAHSQQSCIVSTPPVTSSPTPPSKDYRTSSANVIRPSVSVYNSQSPKSTNSEKSSRPSSNTPSSFVSPSSKPPQIQTKAQSKIYPEIINEQRKSCDSNDKLQPQSSPISYSIMDAPGRLSYSNSTSSSSKSNRMNNSPYSSSQNSSFRHYQSGNNVESDYHVRAKSSSSTDTGYSSSSSQNGPDCGVVASRRQSPLQSAPQTSPLGHGSSPAYPMYHSPMNSINSPQQHGDHYSKVNNSAPRSPLDASVSRSPSQNTQVAYPSVITRALGIEHSKSFNDNRYERGQSQTSSQPCWEADRQISRKYNTSSSNNNGNYSSLSENNTHAEKPAQQSQTPTDRLINERHHYFDGNNVALQDLSSCRGDPMSIVKNLQTLQQSCQVQDIKSSKSQPSTSNTSPLNKSLPRRKSTEKPVPHANVNEISNVVMADYLANRIPPPAHSSTNNQQQNGSYFDFERWNLPPPPPKMFPGTTPFGSQAPLHASNFANQHQALAMQHGHALTYFPPFHLGPHPEFQSSVELTPLSSFSETPPSASSSSFSTPETREEEQPKVVVPNIEEELGFLAEQRANTASSVAPSSQQQSINSASQDATKIMEKKFNVPVTGPGSGFMASYLKFLQGERDTSPPPAGRGARKSTWSRANTNSNSNSNTKTFTPNDHTKSQCEANAPQQSANGAMAPTNAINTGMSLSNPVMSSPASMSTGGLLGTSQIHGTPANLLSAQGKSEMDDPRYYNMSKDRKRKYDGNEEAYDAEEEARRLNKPVLNVPSTPLNDKGKKGRAAMSKPTPSASVASVAPVASVASVAPQPAAPKKPRAPAPPPVAALQPAPQQQYYYQHQPEEGAFNLLDFHLRSRARW